MNTLLIKLAGDKGGAKLQGKVRNASLDWVPPWKIQSTGLDCREPGLAKLINLVLGPLTYSDHGRGGLSPNPHHSNSRGVTV